MRRIITTTALLLCTATAVGAQVPPQNTYKDLIRPNGQMRGAAVHQADVEACYQQTGASRYLPDSAAMKKCMASRGYRFVSQSRGSSGRAVAGRSVRNHNPVPDSGPIPDETPPAPPVPVTVPPIFDSTTGLPVPGSGG